MNFLDKWKAGIAMITPLQQLEATQKGNWVMLVGLCAGLIVMGFNFKQFWWVEIILSAGLFNQVIMMVGVQQKINIFRSLA